MQHRIIALTLTILIGAVAASCLNGTALDLLDAAIGQHQSEQGKIGAYFWGFYTIRKDHYFFVAPDPLAQRFDDSAQEAF
jgi:hypothetical protein